MVNIFFNIMNGLINFYRLPCKYIRFSKLKFTPISTCDILGNENSQHIGKFPDYCVIISNNVIITV